MRLLEAIEVLKKELDKEHCAVIETNEFPTVRMLFNGVDWIWYATSGKRKNNDYSDCTIDYIEIHEYNKVMMGYVGTISRCGNKWELDECYYDAFGKEFSKCPEGYAETMTQINILGYYKTFKGAIKSLMTAGNSTLNHRKPIDVYI